MFIIERKIWTFYSCTMSTENDANNNLANGKADKTERKQ